MGAAHSCEHKVEIKSKVMRCSWANKRAVWPRYTDDVVIAGYSLKRWIISV